MMDMRKQIAEHQGVDPFSFLLAIVEDNQIKRMLCKNKKIKDLDDVRQAVIFAMQIDPEVFLKQRDNASYAKLQEVS